MAEFLRSQIRRGENSEFPFAPAATRGSQYQGGVDGRVLAPLPFAWPALEFLNVYIYLDAHADTAHN